MSKAEIRTFDGETFNIVKIVEEDKEAGIVLVSTDARLGAVRTLRVSVAVPSVGEKVFIINGNAATDQAVTEVTVLATEVSPAGRGIKLSAFLASNSDGSPV